MLLLFMFSTAGCLTRSLLGSVYTGTKTQTNRIRYKKSIPSTRNRLKKRVRPHETARPAGDAVVYMPGL